LAIDEVLKNSMGPTDRFAGFVSATGSAGTIAAGDRLKELYPSSKIIASEALQCPTLLENGFGDHRIEGIGDKHVPWIHNVRNTDLVVAIDDADPLALLRLFNEPVGRVFLIKQGVPPSLVSQLGLLGISGIANLLSCIKVAKRLQLGRNDILFTVFTDSMDLYGSRLEEAEKSQGRYSERQASLDLQVHLNGQTIDHMLELDIQGRRRIHNLKYFTWVEQQGKDVDELRAQWDEYQTYWPLRFRMADEYDRLIHAFNQKTGLLKKYQ
jgi:cysteine synthase